MHKQKYKHLSGEERDKIAILRAKGFTISEIEHNVRGHACAVCVGSDTKIDIVNYDINHRMGESEADNPILKSRLGYSPISSAQG